MELGLREGWQEEEITFLEYLLCVRVRRAQGWVCGEVQSLRRLRVGRAGEPGLQGIQSQTDVRPGSKV